MQNTEAHDYFWAKIVSFFFPVIGLLAFALNIGRNEEAANVCAKWSILGILFWIVVGCLLLLLAAMVTS